MKRIFFILCTGLLAFAACSPGQVILKPEFIKIQDVEVRELTERDAIVRVRTRFHNPNPMGCTLENITFIAFIDGRPLGVSRIQGITSLKADEDFELILDTRLLLESIPGVLVSVFSKPEIEVEVRGEGTLVTAVKNITFSFNPKGRLEVKNRLKNLIRLKLFSKLTEAGIPLLSTP